MKYRFKRAETEQEFAQIARLNHAVFAAELAQHAELPQGMLVDKFHAKNTYFIALDQEHVAGMISVHVQPPFSVAEKLADPGVLDGLGRIVEIRLLAIDPAYRKGAILAGLFWWVFDYCRDRDTMVISGRQEEQKMYRRIGFAPLGPAVASGGAMFVPMAASIAALTAKWQEKYEALSGCV
jgi:hypothetical protein